MGFVSFPASDTEPAKSGPGVAQHLAHVYKEYVAAFDSVYINTVMDSRRKNDASLTAQRGMMGGGVNGPPQLPRGGGITDPQQMQLVMAYANIPPAELRRRNIPEQLIQFIETNRDALKRTLAEQANFRSQLGRPPEQGGIHPGGPPFGGSPPAGGMGNGPGMMQPGRFMHPVMQNNSMDFQQQPTSGLQRPSREMLQAAMVHITKLKTEFSAERMFRDSNQRPDN
jgi:hypothetical protein